MEAVEIFTRAVLLITGVVVGMTIQKIINAYKK